MGGKLFGDSVADVLAARYGRTVTGMCAQVAYGMVVFARKTRASKIGLTALCHGIASGEILSIGGWDMAYLSEWLFKAVIIGKHLYEKEED